MMKVWPFGVALRGEASNHLMLRWLKTVVVNDEEKAPGRCQVGIRKANESESLLTCRNLETTSKPGCQCDPGMSLAGARLLARWCPACRRREPGLLRPCGTGEGASGNILPGQVGERECPKRSEAVRDRVPSPDAPADRLVVVVKLL